MRKELQTDKNGKPVGWDEITTKRVRFDGFIDLKFSKVKAWNDYVDKYKPSRPKGRAHCEFCGVKWKTRPDDEWTALVQTTKGNKVLCMKCADRFKLEDK